MIGRMIVATAMVFAAATAVSPRALQHEGHQTATAAPAQDAAAAASCARAHDTVGRLVEGAKLRLEAAKQTNSAAAMRDAIDDLQSVLVDISAQLASCATPAAAPAHAH